MDFTGFDETLNLAILWHALMVILQRFVRLVDACKDATPWLGWLGDDPLEFREFPQPL